jgi:hypothetical protein
MFATRNPQYLALVLPGFKRFLSLRVRENRRKIRENMTSDRLIFHAVMLYQYGIDLLPEPVL